MPNLEWIPKEAYPTPVCDTPGITPGGASVIGNMIQTWSTISGIHAAEQASIRVGEPTTSPSVQIALWFADQVRPGGEWDYKQDGSQYESFGNYHFGVIGSAIGYSPELLLRAAGAVQSATDLARVVGGNPPVGDGGWFFGSAPYGDQNTDQRNIQRGIEAYQSFMRGECLMP